MAVSCIKQQRRSGSATVASGHPSDKIPDCVGKTRAENFIVVTPGRIPGSGAAPGMLVVSLWDLNYGFWYH